MRIFLTGLLVLVVGVAGWMLFSPMRDSAAGVGVNTVVVNDVTTASAGQETWSPAMVGADVFFGDRIATAAASRLEVRLLDRSNLSVGANARLTIDRFVYDPSRNAAGAMVSVLTGAFRYASDEGKPEQVAFRTPGATIGIRGTVIEGVVGPEAVALIADMTGGPDLSADADSAAVIILRSGAADVRVGTETVVLDQPGEAVILTRRRLYAPFTATAETTKRLESLLPSTPGAPDETEPPPAPEPEPARAGEPAPTPATALPPATVQPPVRRPVREPLTRPGGLTAPQTRPAPAASNPTGPGTVGSGPISGPAAGPGTAPPPAASAPPSEPNNQPTAAPPPTDGAQQTKPTDGGALPRVGQNQPSPSRPTDERPTDSRPTTAPTDIRPTQPQTQPRPVAPGGATGARRN